MTRVLFGAAFFAGYSLCCYFCWAALEAPEPRFVLHGAGTPTSFTSDGRLMVTIGPIGPVRVWDLKTGGLAGSVLTAQQHVRHAELAPNGSWLAVDEGEAAAAGILHVFDLKDGKEHARFETPARIWGFLRFSPDNRLLAASTPKPNAPQISVWNLKEKGPPLILPAGPSFAFAPGGEQLAGSAVINPGTNAERGEIRLFQLATGELRRTYPLRTGRTHVDMVFSPDGGALCAECIDRSGTRVCGWETATGKELFTVYDGSSPRFLSNGGAVVIQSSKRFIFLDTETWKERARLEPGEGSDGMAARLLPQVPLENAVFERNGGSNPLADLIGVEDKEGAKTGFVEVRDARNGATLASIRLADRFRAGPIPTPDRATLLIAKSAPDGSEARLEVWDVPPKSPWKLRAAILAALAVPFGLGAWAVLRRRRPAKTEICPPQSAPSINSAAGA